MAVLVTIFSDFTCPFSYLTEVGLRRVVQARERIEVVYRALELYPEPAGNAVPTGAEWETAAGLADLLGLVLRSPAFTPRTRKAHEAARFAAHRGIGDAMRDAIYSAYWADERDIGRIDVLMELVEALGVDPVELKIALDIDQFEAEVARDIEVARRLRVPGAPTIFIGTGSNAVILLGAQAPEDLDEAIRAG